MNVAVDTCVIIDLADMSSMEAFGEVPDLSFFVTDSVRHEVLRDDQREMLSTEIGRGTIAGARVEDMDDLALYAFLRQKNNEGECSCLAHALKTEDGCIATGETKPKFMKVAVPLLRDEKRILRTADILGRRRLQAAE